MRKLALLAVLVIVIILGRPVQAQAGRSELFGGYSLERIAGGCGSDYRCGVNDLGATTNLNGWIASMTGYFFRSLGASAQFSGDYGGIGFNGGGGLSSSYRYSYLFGPVYALRLPRVSPFAHALFGGVSQGVSQGAINGHPPTYSTFLWSLGGGVDVGLSHHLSIRAAQMDYERQQVPVEGATAASMSPTNGFRYSAGLVLRY